MRTCFLRTLDEIPYAHGASTRNASRVSVSLRMSYLRRDDRDRRCLHAGVMRWSEKERGCNAGDKHDEQLERLRACTTASGEHQRLPALRRAAGQPPRRLWIVVGEEGRSAAYSSSL